MDRPHKLSHSPTGFPLFADPPNRSFIPGKGEGGGQRKVQANGEAEGRNEEREIAGPPATLRGPVPSFLHSFALSRTLQLVSFLRPPKTGSFLQPSQTLLWEPNPKPLRPPETAQRAPRARAKELEGPRPPLRFAAPGHGALNSSIGHPGSISLLLPWVLFCSILLRRLRTRRKPKVYVGFSAAFYSGKAHRSIWLVGWD